MAALRNLAIGALRLAGRNDVTEATDGPAVPWTAHSPSSDSHHDLGTAVARGAAENPLNKLGANFWRFRREGTRSCLQESAVAASSAAAMS